MKGEYSRGHVSDKGGAHLIGAVDTFGFCDPLMLLIVDKHILLQHVEIFLYLGKGDNLIKRLSLRDEYLSFGRGNEYVRLDVAESVLYKLIQTVVDRQDDDQGRCSDRHADGADRGNDVDHIV